MFNEYLQEDGLLNALDYREKNYETDSLGTEFYQRNVKTLIQVGIKKTTPSFATDMPLDIVPQSNPYKYLDNDSASFTVLFNKAPLESQLVKVWQNRSGKTQVLNLQTDAVGKIKFKVTTSGMWMVSTVNMVRLQNDVKAKWQSYWGSCTWGY